MSNAVEDTLQHFGILGQKWGIRRFQNPDGTLTEAGKKRNEKQVRKEIRNRNTDLFINSNNYAAERINGKWLDDFNKKWEKEFKGYDDWSESPKYEKYTEAYVKNLVKLCNDYLKNDKNAKFTTDFGETYIAKCLEEQGQNIIWATEKEWNEHNNKK